jgi:hypothetical protein
MVSYNTLQAQNSIKSVVNFQKDKLIVNGKCIDPSQLSNKYFFNEYINVKFKNSWNQNNLYQISYTQKQYVLMWQKFLY